MQKVVKFLEAYVQWIALSLGILWVLWMGYSYWASSPVVADINGQKVAPGEVEEVAVALRRTGAERAEVGLHALAVGHEIERRAVAEERALLRVTG